ncbi:hypothetical protein AUC43_05080 [Hymenobacter sedentarius]|uniref:Secretion system C-terminal sorting domain-containing protein n=1 Tax=Hymenobacter sedentarius TaxID=1411621 RepID=A0A0U4C0K5_9BACT|nr:hypothetical protein AUC43_05080 [Hymenobacter sedentarius]
MLSPLAGHAQAKITWTVGTSKNSDYPTIGAALADVPATLNKPYELQLIDPSYSEDVLLNKTGSVGNTLTIRPAVNEIVSITGTVTFGSGSAYTSLIGNSGSSAQKTRAITLRQQDLTKSTLVFKDDASNNVVSEVVILGATSSLTSGVVVVGDGVSTGNDNNSLTKSFIANSGPALIPANLVYAANAGGGTNDAFTLSGNELFDFSNAGVLVAAGNGDQWTISGNSIYNNLAVAPTTAQTGIAFQAGSGANDVTVTNNFIGGDSPSATGSWVNAGTQDFRGIVMNCGLSTTLNNVVTGNTVRNIKLTGAGNQSLFALEMAAGRIELNTNTATLLNNAGTGGVLNLKTRATLVLSPFTIETGQKMAVEGGLTEVQGNLTITGILTNTGGYILINGDLIGAGSFGQTAGNLEIKGNMLNTGQFNCYSGKVLLTGVGTQKVSGGSYSNLEVNGSSTKTFTGNATVYDGVQMVSGVLATTNRYSLNLASLANLTETETSYVLGRVDVSRTPVADKIENFGGIGLLMQPAAASTLPGLTNVTRITGTAPIGVYGREGVLRYFDIDTEVTTDLNVNMTFMYFTHELNGIASANLKFFKSLSGSTPWQNKGVSSLGAGYAVLNGIDNFASARWTLGDVTNPLPVGLTAFQAERQGRNAVLTWATASEHNNRGFGIEVSLDGKSFKQIGFVEAAGNGNSNSAQAYRFVDAAEGKVGARYYRLRQVDQNEAASFYGPQQLNFDAQVASFAAYPTQFASGFTVALTSPTASTATLRLIDIMGREVWRQEVASGVRQVQPNCAAGSYILTATINGQVLRQRVVKE